MLKPAVVVVGSYVQDLTWRCARLPHAGETIVGVFATGPGGKGSNQAVAAARAGVATGFVGAIGCDAFAAAAKRFHRAEKISSRLVTTPRHATGTAAILVDRHGQNQIIVALGASAILAPRDVPAALIGGARVVVCQHESNLAVNARVFRLARRAGAITMLNPAPMRADFDPAILALTDVLIPNEHEFLALAGRLHLDERALRALRPRDLHLLCRTLGVPTVVVTLGGRGCFVSERDRFTALPAHRVKVVDTTGAGDAFTGGFAAGLVKFSGDPLAAARFANAVAALSVTKFGTAPSMPTRPEIARFLRTRRPDARLHRHHR